MLVKLLPLFAGVVTFGVVGVLVIGFTGEVGALVTGVVIGLTGVFVFVMGLTGAVGVLVVLVMGLTGDVFTALDVGLTVVAVFGAIGLTTEVGNLIPPAVIGAVGAVGGVTGVLTPPTGRFTGGAKVPPLSTGGRITEVTA
jgi:hypothetical protein